MICTGTNLRMYLILSGPKFCIGPTIVSVGLILGGIANARLMFLELEDSTPAAYSTRLNNQNIVMIGDSLMRYQYLSLAYLAHTSSFVSPSERPNLLIHQSYNSWAEYYTAASEMLAPNEYSECFPGMFENHYYRNKERNLSITLLVYAGLEHPPKGVWVPTESERFPSYRKLIVQNTTLNWRCSVVEEVFTRIATKLDPRPTTLVLNAGHWKNDWHEAGREKAVLTSALNNFNRVIWKTTTYNKDHQPGDYVHDSTCHYPGIECMNQDWTKYVSSDRYTDRLHFTPEIYSDINTQFLFQLTKHRPLHVAPLSSAHYGQIIVYKNKHYLVDNEGLLRTFTLPTENEQTSACHKDIAARKHVHKPWSVLITHILGDHIANVCDFIVK